MKNADMDEITNCVLLIAGSLDRIADALEVLCIPHSDALAAPTGERAAIFEALRAIAINVDRP